MWQVFHSEPRHSLSSLADIYPTAALKTYKNSGFFLTLDLKQMNAMVTFKQNWLIA